MFTKITVQNWISWKSTKNTPTSGPRNFFKNGRTRLVYDSFWSQGPPKLQKTGLGWFPQLARPLWTDLRIFSIFSEISIWAAATQKVIFWLQSPKKWSKINFFFKFFEFSKKYDTSAPEWYIYIGRTPNISGAWIFWNLVVPFYKAMWFALFWKPLNRENIEHFYNL